MANPKDVLVITTGASDDLKIKKYLKPVSAHIVAGTNLFSDFLGGLSDVFGGRSDSYQKQLSSLYNEAIEKLKHNTYEIGGNGVIGLKIDMDEISGKGKSMFMLTAIGTAVIIDKEDTIKSKVLLTNDKFQNIGIERFKGLQIKNEIIRKANDGKLKLDDETWNFIISNQITDVFHYVTEELQNHLSDNENDDFVKYFTDYIENLEDGIIINLLYNYVKNKPNNQTINILLNIIKDLNLYDFNRNMELLSNDNFNIKKIGVQIATYNKPFFNKQDISDFTEVINMLNIQFKERGIRSTVESNSRIREIWTCDCENKNDLSDYCYNCGKDIYGFTKTEINPEEAIKLIKEKIELIKEFIE